MHNETSFTISTDLSNSDNWVAHLAARDFTSYEKRIPCDGAAKAHQWLDWKQKQGTLFLHRNEKLEYDLFLADLIATASARKVTVSAEQIYTRTEWPVSGSVLAWIDDQADSVYESAMHGLVLFNGRLSEGRESDVLIMWDCTGQWKAVITPDPGLNPHYYFTRFGNTALQAFRQALAAFKCSLQQVSPTACTLIPNNVMGIQA